MMDYQDLKIYCNQKKITFPEFGKMVDPDGELGWITYYKIISGLSKAGKRTGRKLDAFIASHAAEIRAALDGPDRAA